MTSCLFQYPDEKPLFALGVASEFTDDGLRAEDLLAIPDLAAGAFSETLMTMGTANIPTSGSGPGGHTLWLKTKSTLINGFLAQTGNPLKVMSCVVRRHPQGMMLSFGRPFVRLPRPGESTEGEVPTNEKWLKSLAVELARIGADPEGCSGPCGSRAARQQRTPNKEMKPSGNGGRPKTESNVVGAISAAYPRRYVAESSALTRDDRI